MSTQIITIEALMELIHSKEEDRKPDYKTAEKSAG